MLHQLLVAGLAREGLGIRDVKFVQMGIPQSFSALMSGKVDAALIAAGALVKAKQAGKPVIATATGLVTPILAMCASKKFIEEQPELLKDVVAVQDEAYDWIMTHHDEAVALGAAPLGKGCVYLVMPFVLYILAMVSRGMDMRWALPCSKSTASSISTSLRKLFLLSRYITLSLSSRSGL